MLSQHQLQEFDRSGLIRLPAAIPPDATAAMRDRIWSFLHERDGIEQANVSGWPVGGVAQFQRLARSDAFDPMWKATALSVAIDDLLGKGRWCRGRNGILVTFPQPEVVWTVPTSAWHLDAPPRMLGAQLPGTVASVRLFIILDDLGAHGGGTLVLAGSHRLVKAYLATSGPEPRNREIKAALGSAHQWLDGLWGGAAHSDGDAPSRIGRYMDDGAIVDDIPLLVKELHGAEGDVFLMDSDCFHAASPNSLERPRIMLASSGG